ncbi:HEXXH motif-containing putative peptide modification protein [Streptacidiphilus sp. EB103A]|uniref:aKG-HExxH-type peptide beta-hydroxylase n=1 Tax=Streptacidiphilus sp. EB103A TaxID=3156275 RepID=UPI0035120AF4
MSKVRKSTDVYVDVSRLRPLFDEPAPPVDLSRAVLPGHPDDPTRALDRMVGKLYLKRLLVLLRDHGNACESPRVRHSVQGLVDGLLRLPHEELIRVVLRPEVTSWIKTAQRVRDGERRLSPETLLGYAGTFLMPTLLRPDILEDAEILAVAADGELPLASLHRALRVAAAPNALLTVRVVGASLRVDGGGKRIELPLEALSGKGDGRAFPEIRDLPTLPEGPLITGPQAWHDIAYPESASRPLDLTAEGLVEFAAAIGSGLSTIDRYWPEAATVVRRTAVHLMPVRSQGNSPFNFTLHEFRGLIMTSGRHTYMAAQTLVHETAHNRFNSILDLYQVTANADEERYSPFVEVPRPMVNLFHGVFAFLNDVQMAIRCADAFGPADGPPIAPYVDDITDRLSVGLDTLERHAQVTEQGAQLLDGFRAAMPR